MYVIEAPFRWNGVLVLYCHPVPVSPGEPPWEPGELVIDQLVRHGYAVAGSANTIFWPLELVLGDQPALIEVARDVLGPPRHVIGAGVSIGGLISAARVQRLPQHLSGALPMCGNLAGAVATHNRELDMAFVVKTLLAPDSPLELVHISEPKANLDLALAVLHEAQATAVGRARLALAAAVGNVPGWYGPTTDQPAVHDVAARQHHQFAWFDGVGFLVYFWAREQVERQAQGNPSWNTGVDYRRMLADSINGDEVEALYRQAGIPLDDDLQRLDSAVRIDADAAAVDYLEDHIVFDGDLQGIPVLTVHTDGDGLVTPDHEHAYAEVVGHAGHGDLLRQLFVHRGGHCTFTVAEMVTALEVLLERIEAGAWPDLDPGLLNDTALRLGAQGNVLESGEAMEPRFFDFEPRPFFRRYDARDISAS